VVNIEKNMRLQIRTVLVMVNISVVDSPRNIEVVPNVLETEGADVPRTQASNEKSSTRKAENGNGQKSRIREAHFSTFVGNVQRDL